MNDPRAQAHWVTRDTREPGRLVDCEAWTRTLHEHLAKDDVLELLHGTVVIGRSLPLRSLMRALRELAVHADDALEQQARWRDAPVAERTVSIEEQTLLLAICHHGYAVDDGVCVLGARLRKAAVPPVDKLYPAERYRQLATTPAGAARPNRYVQRITARVARAAPAVWQDVVESLGALGVGQGDGASWPAPQVARRATLALSALTPSWDAEGLMVREQERRSHKLSTGERRDLDYALKWCVATRHVLERLASPLGWLRLVLDYLLEIRRGAARIMLEARRDAPTSTIVDIVLHELAHLLSSVDADPAATARSLFDRDAGPDASRMRLSRGRERCLARWTSCEPDADWDDEDFVHLLIELDELLAQAEVQR